MSIKSTAKKVKKEIKATAENIKDKVLDAKDEVKDKTTDIAEKGASKVATNEMKKKFGLETEDQSKNASGPIYEICFRLIKSK